MQNGILRQSKRAANAACVISLALVSFNCIDKPLDPVGPTWETQVTSPLSVKAYSVTDLAKKAPTLVLGTLGTQSSVPLSVTFSSTGGHFSDTAVIGDSSGSDQGHTLVDSTTAHDFTSIKIHVTVDNSIPLDASVKLHFLDAAKRLVMDIPQAAGDSVTVPAPAVVGGVVQSPSHTERILTLSDTEIQQFNKSYLIVYYLQVLVPGANIPAIQATQTINIRVWAELTYQVNK